MKPLSTLLLCLLTLPASAQTLKLEDGACDMLVKHVPSPNVGYQPGVDAYGRQVAEADMPSARVPLGPIEIPLSVDLASRLHLGGMGTTTGTQTGSQTGTGTNTAIGPGGVVGHYGNEAYVGTVTIDGQTVLLNGQPLTDETEDNLAILCMRANPPGGPPQ